MLVALSSRNLRNLMILTLLCVSGRTDSSIIPAIPTSGSHSYAQAGVPDQPDPGVPIPIMRLNPKRCSTCRSEKKLRLAIRDRDEWRAVWEAINQPVLPKMLIPRLPEIDFAREMVVLVAMGERPSSGYSILIDSAHERNDQLEIDVVSRSPQHCIELTVMTYPLDIAILRKTELSAVFKETDLVHECK